MSQRRFGATDVTALAATLAALAAVGVSVWDHFQQREFYRLSVIPRLDYTPTKEGATEGSVILTNEGVGPAEIRSLEIGLCGADGSGSFTSWNEARESIQKRELTLTGYHDITSGEFLGQGHVVEWVHFRSRDGAPSEDRIQRLIDDLGFRIRYSSIYDQTFTLERNPSCLAPGTDAR